MIVLWGYEAATALKVQLAGSLDKLPRDIDIRPQRKK